MENPSHQSGGASFSASSCSPLPSRDPGLCPSSMTLFLLPSLYILLFLTSLPGNAISLWVFLRRIPNRSPTHVYLFHLGVSNLLVVLTTPLFAAYFAWGSNWPRGGALCQLVLRGGTPVLHINIYISIILLTWLAFTRLAILNQRPPSSRPERCTTRLPQAVFTSLRKVAFARIVCTSTWLFLAASVVPVTVYYSIYEVEAENQTWTGKNVGSGRGENAGEEDMCYSLVVEIGGSLSRACCVPVVATFFVCFLMVVSCYVAVLQNIWRSRRGTFITDSQRLLGRVFRNIMVIQVIFVVCLMPYQIFKPIFISLVNHHIELNYTHHSSIGPGSNSTSHCHPLENIIEVKNFLVWLAAVRGSTDPVMYFLLDRTFRNQTLSLFGSCKPTVNDSKLSGSTQDKA